MILAWARQQLFLVVSVAPLVRAFTHVLLAIRCLPPKVAGSNPDGGNLPYIECAVCQ